MTPVKQGDWCRIVNAKKLKGSGLSTGDEVYVMGSDFFPEKRTDPYLRRMYVVVAKVVGDDLQVPTNDNDIMAYRLDPRNLEVLDPERAEKLEKTLKDRYDVDESNPE